MCNCQRDYICKTHKQERRQLVENLRGLASGELALAVDHRGQLHLIPATGV